METTPGGWLGGANATLGECGLQCFLDRRDGDKGFIAFAIVGPKSPGGWRAFTIAAADTASRRSNRVGPLVARSEATGVLL